MSNPNYKEHPFIGAGKLFINTRQVGNCSDVKLSYNVEQKSLPNNMGGGGNLDSTDRISSVKLDLTCTNFSPENLAIALAASLDSITTAAEVPAEKLMMAANSFVDTEFMIDMTKANLVEVKTTATTPKTIPQLDVDGKENYVVTPAGIYFKDGKDVTDAEVSVKYTKSLQVILQALMATGREFKLVMDGINDANGDPLILRVWRWKPAPTDGIGLISDDYGNFTMKGEVLADVSRPAGKSRFFEMIHKKAA